MRILPPVYSLKVNEEVLKMLFGKRRIQKKSYDRINRKPAIRSSICTGERVAGFVDMHSGHFQEIMLIRSQKDIDDFKETYDIEGELETIY